MKSKAFRRAWGSYEILSEQSEYKVKKIEVEPSHRLSYQSHNHRSELWCFVAGLGLVTIDGTETYVKYGDFVQFPAKTKHRVENVGEDLLVFIEVQTGSSFEEEDIIRYEDDYGRK